ncbi:hypothetical protein WG66_011949 [Moniliophthora roreri]|nr:hypothetical protein WG66_011949 [Moniliophthora roreri]
MAYFRAMQLELAICSAYRHVVLASFLGKTKPEFDHLPQHGKPQPQGGLPCAQNTLSYASVITLLVIASKTSAPQYIARLVN